MNNFIGLRTARRSDLEGIVNLAKTRQWFANNQVLYGFANLEYLFSQRIVTVQVETIQTAVAESLAEYSRQVENFMSAMVSVTTDYKKRFQLPSSGTLQPLDNNGNPFPVVPSGFYDIAFPIYGAGTAWGTDRLSRAIMTIGDANRFTMDAMTKDKDWMRRHLLAALFTNVTFPYTDEAYGALTVQPLANSDAVTYVKKNGTASADNHFYAQAAVIATATNPFSTIYTMLDEHPGNSGPYNVYIASNLVSAVQGLATFRPPFDSNIIWGQNNNISINEVNTNVTSKDMFTNGIGDRFIGYVDGCNVIEWSALPSNYLIGHASSVNDVIGMRQYVQPELQGLFPEFWNVNGNHMESRLIRYAGFGIQNRVGAVVGYVGVSGTYAIPTGYQQPLAA